jgi:hypothetical protein
MQIAFQNQQPSKTFLMTDLGQGSNQDRSQSLDTIIERCEHQGSVIGDGDRVLEVG